MNLSDFKRENTLECKTICIKDTISYKFDLDGAKEQLKDFEDLRVKIRQLSITQLQRARELIIAGDNLGYVASVCEAGLFDAKTGEPTKAQEVANMKPAALAVYICLAGEITQYSEGVDAHNYEARQEELKAALKDARPNARKKA